MGDVNHGGTPPGRGPRFQTTRWTVVMAARGGTTPEAREALAALCRDYWYPLYAFSRRRGHSPEAAEDLVQGFFARLLEKGDLAAVDRPQGTVPFVPARGLLALCVQPGGS